MDPFALLVLALGSLALLDVAAVNLRGEERPTRLARPGDRGRDRRSRS
jgi:hypothetical protein